MPASGSPRGQTPRRRERRRPHRRLSTLGALTISPRRRRLNGYLQFHADRSMGQEQVLAFPRHLRRHLRGPLLVVWDCLHTHRSAAVRQYVQRQAGRRTTLLPAYAPELNPIEYGGAYLKHNPLANLCPADVAELQEHVQAATETVGSPPSLLRGLVRKADLTIRLLPART